MGQRNVIVRGRKRLFEQSEGSGIPAAESYLGLVVEYQFIRGAGAADRADLSVDAPFLQLRPPIIGIGNQRSVFEIDKPFGDRQHRQPGIKIYQYLVQEPIHTERRNTADNEIGSGDCLSVFLYLIIFYSDGERSVEFGMLIAAAAFVDDVTVEDACLPNALHDRFRRRETPERTPSCRNR